MGADIKNAFGFVLRALSVFVNCGFLFALAVQLLVRVVRCCFSCGAGFEK